MAKFLLGFVSWDVSGAFLEEFLSGKAPEVKQDLMGEQESLKSCRNQNFPGKTAWKIPLGKAESILERIPGSSFATRSQHIPNFCLQRIPGQGKGAAGTSWNYWSKNPGGKWCGKKDTAENIPALRMNPTPWNFLDGLGKNALGSIQCVQGFLIFIFPRGKMLEWDHWGLLVSQSPWVNLSAFPKSQPWPKQENSFGNAELSPWNLWDLVTTILESIKWLQNPSPVGFFGIFLPVLTQILLTHLFLSRELYPAPNFHLFPSGSGEIPEHPSVNKTNI